MMDEAEIAQLKSADGVGRHAQRSARRLPKLPDMLPRVIPAPNTSRSNRPTCRKSWLFAGHMDEIPEPGCYMRWHNAGIRS